MPLDQFQIVILFGEHLVTLGQLLLVDKLETLKVIDFSLCLLVDIVDIVSNGFHVVQSKQFPRDLKTWGGGTPTQE